jgi:hypothetical protein
MHLVRVIEVEQVESVDEEMRNWMGEMEEPVGLLWEKNLEMV